MSMITKFTIFITGKAVKFQINETICYRILKQISSEIQPCPCTSSQINDKLFNETMDMIWAEIIQVYLRYIKRDVLEI